MWCIFALLSAITAAYLLGATFVLASPACQDASPYNTADSKGTTEIKSRCTPIEVPKRESSTLTVNDLIDILRKN